MKTINFSYNWNKKLDCDFLTTIRLNAFYEENDLVFIKCQKRETDSGIITLKIKTKLSKLTDLICYLDTGYSKQITVGLIKKMYKGVTDWNTQDIYIYGILRKYKGKKETLIDVLKEDGLISKEELTPDDVIMLDFMNGTQSEITQ